MKLYFLFDQDGDLFIDVDSDNHQFIHGSPFKKMMVEKYKYYLRSGWKVKEVEVAGLD